MKLTVETGDLNKDGVGVYTYTIAVCLCVQGETEGRGPAFYMCKTGKCRPETFTSRDVRLDGLPQGEPQAANRRPLAILVVDTLSKANVWTTGHYFIRDGA